MRLTLSLAFVALAFATANITTARPADARIYCFHHYGCVEGKYTRKPIAGMTCRSTTSRNPNRRTFFFCRSA